MTEHRAAHKQSRVSFFWPVILIGAGVIALMINSGHLALSNLWALLNLWPVLLVLAGIDLLFSRHWPGVGALLALALVGGVIWLLMTGNLADTVGGNLTVGDFTITTSPPEVTRDRYTEESQGAEDYAVDLGLAHFDTEIRALPADNSLLFDATIDHIATVRYAVSGDENRRISLAADSIPVNLGLLGSQAYGWDVGLSPAAPVELSIDVGSGDLFMDLSELMVRRLDIDCGSGDVDATLPRGEYTVDVEGASGEMSIALADDSTTTLELDGGSGGTQVIVGQNSDVTVHLRDGGSGDLRVLVPRASGVAVQVDDGGSGEVLLPSDLVQQRGDSREGRWEAEGYAMAGHTVSIEVDEMGSGDLIVSYR